MKMLNKRGPRIDPCGTPRSILHHSLKLLFIFTLWNRSDRWLTTDTYTTTIKYLNLEDRQTTTYKKTKLAAETLALSDACDLSLAKKMIYPKRSKDINIEGYNNNHSLSETWTTTKSIFDKRLRVAISVLREMCVLDELPIHLTEKQYQLSRVLPKKGAPH